MKKSWIIGIIVFVVYLAGIVGATWYFSFPSLIERQAVQVLPKVVNANPITDESAKKMSEREKYGDWPIEIRDDQMGKVNPFRLR